MCRTHKYKIQIHKYTNTAYDEVPKRPNMWYIFEKEIVQGYQYCWSIAPQTNFINWQCKQRLRINRLLHWPLKVYLLHFLSRSFSVWCLFGTTCQWGKVRKSFWWTWKVDLCRPLDGEEEVAKLLFICSLPKAMSISRGEILRRINKSGEKCQSYALKEIIANSNELLEFIENSMPSLVILRSFLQWRWQWASI